MSQQELEALAVGLSEAEKDDLEKMIVEFRRDRPQDDSNEIGEPLQDQVDRLGRSLADLSERILTADRRMDSLVEIMRLSHQKSELLSQRLDAVIAALKKGRMI